MGGRGASARGGAGGGSVARDRTVQAYDKQIDSLETHIKRTKERMNYDDERLSNLGRTKEQLKVTLKEAEDDLEYYKKEKNKYIKNLKKGK